MTAATAFAERVREIYRDALVSPAGVVHVASVWASPSGDLVSIRIGDGAPASETDAFALAVARARADAIVTTGAILRAEPRLRIALPPDAAAWRVERLGKAAPPTIVVLTRRADVDLAHPAFASASDVTVVTTATSAEALRARAAATGAGARIDVAALEPSDLRDVVAFLRRERGAATITVEAGVRASRPLYAPPAAVDELMLSIYCGPSLPRAARGAAFVAADDPLRAPLLAGAAVERREASGPWRFGRYRLADIVKRAR